MAHCMVGNVTEMLLKTYSLWFCEKLAAEKVFFLKYATKSPEREPEEAILM